jgi:hypothetical protein
LTTVLIGPGLTAPSPATIAQGSTNAPVINIASDTIHALDVTIDGFIIQGAGGTVDANGIDCTGTASNIGRTRLQLVRSIIQANAQLAINASSCDVNIDQTIIGPVSSTKNAAGGVTLAGCTYSIMNTLIHHNGDTGLASQALSLSGMGSATNKIVNCTIADNSSMTASVPAGVACGETTKPIMFNVALSGNSVGDQTLCTSLMTSAFPGGSVTNKDTSACTSADLFVAPTAAGGYNYAPRPSPTCMVTLTRAGAAAGAPTYDLFASPRPSPAGTNPDIGAVEGP